MKIKLPQILLITCIFLLCSCKNQRAVLSVEPGVDYGYVQKDRKKSLSSSSSLANKGQVGSLAEFLARVPGVMILGNGQSAQARVRGIEHSFVGSSDPLFVLNGQRIGIGLASVNGQISAGDVRSVTVLKDPSDTAIYGTSGSNGVILIRTKGN